MIKGTESCTKRAKSSDGIYLARQKQVYKPYYLEISKMNKQPVKVNRQVQPTFQEEVEVKRDLIGYIIGTNGSNIKEAKKLPGIKDIRLNEEKGTFRISGNTKQAVKLAKKYIDVRQMYSYVPEHLAGHIIGKNGNGVKKIIEDSGVIKIIFNVQGTENIPQVEGMVTVVCVGTEEKILKALTVMTDKISYPLEIHTINKDESSPSREPTPKPPACNSCKDSGDQPGQKGNRKLFRRLLERADYNPYSLLADSEKTRDSGATKPNRGNEEGTGPKSRSGGQQVLRNKNTKKKL